MPVIVGSGYQNSLSEIRAKVRNKLLQTSASNSNWTDAIVDDAINDSLKEMLLEGLTEIAQDSFTTTASQQTWTPSATVWRITAVNYDDTPLTEIRHDQMDSLTGGDWDGQSGDPRYWCMDETQNDRRVTFGKKMPVNKTVKFWYWRCPQDLTSDDELTGMYHVFTPLIVYLAVSILLDSDEGESHRWLTRYQNLLSKAQVHTAELHEERIGQVKDWVGGFSD